MALPSCGLYRTTQAIGEVPAGLLVYFHNHGEPGPGVYLPTSWAHNRARFDARGHTLGSDAQAATLAAVPAEGFYVVKETFWCCEKHCRSFEPDTLVQLGYNGAAEPILFLPTLTDHGLAWPSTGTKTGLPELDKLSLLRVARGEGPTTSSNLGGTLH